VVDVVVNLLTLLLFDVELGLGTPALICRRYLQSLG